MAPSAGSLLDAHPSLHALCMNLPLLVQQEITNGILNDLRGQRLIPTSTEGFEEPRDWPEIRSSRWSDTVVATLP
ncbi:MAG: hypothetical protein CMO40_04760 [Verrucomicrobiaceae bacterium]|nr:hypothetical protein [Verrucomicrobiaceae bacterium]